MYHVPAMSDLRPVLFFSDAHFGAHAPTQEQEKIRRFTGFLHHARAIGAEVFFLGDLFDFWFEYKHWIPHHPVEVTAAIRELTAAGCPFHLVIGNHDCWARDYFPRQLGAELHRGDLTINRQGLRLYISHGDGKAPSDRGYRALKKVLRSPVSIWLYRHIPADWAFRLANYSSGRSRNLTGKRPPKFLEEYDRVAADLLKAGFDAVIMGHVHQGWVRRIGDGWWINTGEWYENFDYVILENGVFRAERWT